MVAAQELPSVLSPGEFGLRRTPFFFMKPSFWSKHRKNYKELYESSINGSLSFSEIVEPVPAEFQGKEAIRCSPCPAWGVSVFENHCWGSSSTGIAEPPHLIPILSAVQPGRSHLRTGVCFL